MNTPRRLVVAIALAGATMAAVAGCGGSQSASKVLAQAFHPGKPATSGQLELALSFSVAGSPGSSAPASVRLGGPFQSVGSGQLPRFALTIAISGGGSRDVQVGAIATGSQFFLELQGVPFVAPANAYQQLKQGYAQATAARSRQSSGAAIGPLSIDPGRWLSHPRLAPGTRMDGVDTNHVVASLNVAQFLADLGRVSSASGVLGLPGTSSSSAFSPAQRSALSRSITSAQADVYAGKQDHVLRDLLVRAHLVVAPADRAALQGLTTGDLGLSLRLSHINQPQTILAPPNPQPFSKLASLLAQQGLTSPQGAAAGGQAATTTPAATTPAATTPAATTPAPAAPAPGGGSSVQSAPTVTPAYVQCTQRAGQNLSALAKCGSLLASR